MPFSTPKGIHRAAHILFIAAISVLTGCARQRGPVVSGLTARAAIEHYRLTRGERRDAPSRTAKWTDLVGDMTAADFVAPTTDIPSFTLTSYGLHDDQAASQPTTQSPARDRIDLTVPEGYWRENALRQAGSELKLFAKHDFWSGYKTAFWDAENLLFLAGTMGASITVRESGVDNTVSRQIRGHRQLRDFDEPLQLLGNPATHAIGAGALWLTSTLTRDFEQHEVSKKLIQALAVNDASTLLLKLATNTSSPDGDSLAWPSGHTSSAFTVAAVVNEYYGPLAGIPSLALAGLVGYQRLDSRTHDLSDVIFGGMMGYIIGSSIARDGKAEFPEVFGMTLIPFNDPQTGAAGLALMKQF